MTKRMMVGLRKLEMEDWTTTSFNPDNQQEASYNQKRAIAKQHNTPLGPRNGLRQNRLGILPTNIYPQTIFLILTSSKVSGYSIPSHPKNANPFPRTPPRCASKQICSMHPNQNIPYLRSVQHTQSHPIIYKTLNFHTT